MSRKASPTAIGAFILAAIALLVTALVLFSPDVGEDRETFQLYFEGSVKGLDVGAPVLVKGVRVGRVRGISLRMEMDSAEQVTGYIVPVTVELSQRRLLASSPDPNEDVAGLIKKGLRARLELDSLVTQKLFVELGFHPDTEARFYDQHAGGLQEIPTIQTGWQELQADLADVDIVQLAAKASSALDGINRILNGPEAIQTLTSLEQSLTHLDELITGLNQDREVLRKSLELTLTDARAALRRMEDLLQGGQAATADTRELLRQMDHTLRQVDEVTGNLNKLLEQDSPTVYKAELALDEIAEAAEAIRQFLQMLEDKPDALLRGR